MLDQVDGEYLGSCAVVPCLSALSDVRFSAGFAWTISNRLVLSKETELGYFMAFGNSIMAEVSRLASLNADRQKADFIGSISHEFRSPLHGNPPSFHILQYQANNKPCEQASLLVLSFLLRQKLTLSKAVL